MSWIVTNLWLIPGLPLAAAGVLALVKQPRRLWAMSLAIGAMVLSFLLACTALGEALQAQASSPLIHKFTWLAVGEFRLELGWVLDPLTAVMVVMVTFVGTLIFIYSIGYMAHDRNATRFFCFLSLFAAAMLGLVIANNLLLLFMCWELVGVSSYLLIGFWYHKPSAAAAAKKAFIVTRIGDVIFFLGMIWLYAETGTLLFYDHGNGCLEQKALTALVGKTLGSGMVVSTAISLLIFCGAMGKSGQVPLHVWLPDAMEGPTPVSALIHAATMVAAGVFLVARVYPLMAQVPDASVTQASQAAIVHAAQASAHPEATSNPETAPHGSAHAAGGAAVSRPSTALKTVTWVGAVTALFAALIAVAQTDIKRILAYSTVSQLGYMMLGLGVGGVAVGMFHLITHAFFKALLFLGAGSVIHGCHEEQDIRYMGGLRRAMPTTFITYAVGMMALSGVPLFFSGFWSKDEILHSASHWPASPWPFWIGVTGALLTAFYMTRQMCYVFFGERRSAAHGAEGAHESGAGHAASTAGPAAATPHESPPVMTYPLIILAVCTVVLGVFGTPVWPWFHDFLSGHAGGGLRPVPAGVIGIMFLSSLIALGGITLGWRWYGRNGAIRSGSLDPLEAKQPDVFALLRQKFFVDELYEMSVIWWSKVVARWADWWDRVIWNGLVQTVSVAVIALSWINRLVDEFVVNLGFDKGCDSLRGSGRWLSRFQNGQVQRYLRIIGLALVVLVLVFVWGGR